MFDSAKTRHLLRLVCSCVKQRTRMLSMDARYFTKLEGVLYRPLRHDDIEELCQLSRLAHKDWYSTDYLPGWLPKVLEDDNRLAYVAERNNQIAGFAMMLGGVDNGSTILGEAGRVHPDHAGFGVLTRVFIQLLQECKKRWPDWYLCRGSNIKAHFYQSDLKSGTIDPLLQRAYIKVHLATGNLQQEHSLLQNTSNFGIESINQKDLQELLSNQNVRQKLYPEGLIPIGYNIFQALSSNVPFICYFHDEIFIDKNASSISIGGQFPCDDGQAWRYNFNYSGLVDLECCMEHLLEHLIHCVSSLPRKEHIHFVVMLPSSFQGKFGMDTLKQLLQDRLNAKTDEILPFTQHMFGYVGFREMHDKHSKLLTQV